MRIYCPNCNAPIDIADNTPAGAILSCGNCGHRGAYTPPQPVQPQKQKKSSGIGWKATGFVVAVCLLSGIAVRVPWVGVVGALSCAAFAVLVFMGKAGTYLDRPKRTAIWSSVAGALLLVFGISGFGMQAQKKEREAAEEAEIKRKQEEQARREKERQEAEAKRRAELRANADKILAEGQEVLAAAQAQFDKEKHTAAHDTAKGAIEDVEELSELSPPIEGASDLAKGLRSLMEDAAAFIQVQEVIEQAENSLAKKYDDALAAFEAYQKHSGALEQLDGEPAREHRRKIRILTRKLKRKERSVKRKAERIRRERAYEQRGLIPVTARKLFRSFHNNEVTAEDKYKGRRLAVTGTVTGVSTDMTGDAVVELRSTNQFMPVHAEMQNRRDAASVSRGNRVELDCKCSGMVIGHVQLTDCKFF